MNASSGWDGSLVRKVHDSTVAAAETLGAVKLLERKRLGFPVQDQGTLSVEGLGVEAGKLVRALDLIWLDFVCAKQTIPLLFFIIGV